MSTTTARVWLLIAHRGGRWTPSEVRDEVRADHSTVQKALEHMGDNGYLQRYEPDKANRYARYGVTRECFVPSGILNWEVAEAMGMRLREEVQEEVVPRGKRVRDVILYAEVVKA